MKNLTYEEFQREASNILNSREYAHLKRDYMNVIKKIVEKIGKWLEGLFENTNMGERVMEVSEPISKAILALIIIAIIALVVLVLLKFKKSKDMSLKEKNILGEVIKEGITSDTFRNRAKEMEKIGKYKDSIRLEFIGLLLKLDENHILYLDETKTNYEFTQELRNKGVSYTHLFINVVEIFNESHYGEVHVDSNYFKRWEGNINPLWNEVLKVEEEV
ncbi:hypothetical protein [Anaeromicrobium sediminis]|uniref:DUF4129 domain-containing protein n=1 Tax=Anaeromicrobium sediminis TaxID=1478221 RepID=A0A267MJT2_9FIRM|nr:hypothetical protein [Anaeromicrobium sediminis]PAB59672.1 hypothetical protein CCE28_08890 [Anaeromicrobium sediminis]